MKRLLPLALLVGGLVLLVAAFWHWVLLAGFGFATWRVLTRRATSPARRVSRHQPNPWLVALVSDVALAIVLGRRRAES